jgi:hypothetical protein
VSKGTGSKNAKGFDMNEYCFSVLFLLSAAWPVQVGVNPKGISASSLQPGPPIERALSAGQPHTYTINLEQGQFVGVIVDQHGIDVVIRTFSPSGQRLGEFDSPNGANGPENVSIAASVAGEYRLEVAPLDPSRNVQPGRYEIRIAERRMATDDELKAARSQELLKARGLALLQDVARSADQFRRPATRAGILIKASQQLWDADETRARRLMEQAIDNVKQVVAAADVNDPNYFQNFQSAMQLRSQVIDVLVAHDPAMALDFLRSTRTLVNPDPRGDAQYNRELQLELSIANRISPKDPVSAFRMAEDTLKQGVSRDIVNTVQQLRTNDAGLATKLSNDIASRLANESFLQHPEAANLATSFLQMNRTAPLIPENEYRNLFQKVVNEALSYTMPFPNSYSMERNAAQSLLNAVKSMSRELQAYAPDQKEAVEKKLLEFDQNGPPFQLYQNIINRSTIDEALEVISRAPSDVRDGLYQQIASRVAQTGDMPRARQIITEHMTNVQQRQQGLRNLDRQAVNNAINQGNLDDALRTLIDFQPASERAQMLNQFLNRIIGSGVKKATAITYLDQIRTILGARRAEDQQQMMALFALARAFPRYDSNRAFAILEPLIDQFNDMSAAAVALNGFFQKFYEDGEVILDNGNIVGSIANELANTLGNLAQTDFDRAKSLADAVHPTDVRLRVYLAIAEHAIQPRY